MIPAFSELPEGAAGASADPARVAAWWDRRPFGILLATGTVLDVIEMPAEIGRAVCAALRDRSELVPVAATSTGRWWIPVAAGSEPWTGGAGGSDDAVDRSAVRLLNRGALVAAPPSECTQGFVHWRVSPSACGWRLPTGELLGELVKTAVTTDDRWPAGTREGRGAQRSTAVPIGVRS